MLADVADERQEGEIFHPVVVVYQDCLIGNLALEIEKFIQLPFDRLLVVAQRFFIEKLAFRRLHGGIADHAGCTTHQCDWRMTGSLEVSQHHHADQVADMQRIGGGIYPHIAGRAFFL